MDGSLDGRLPKMATQIHGSCGARYSLRDIGVIYYLSTCSIPFAQKARDHVKRSPVRETSAAADQPSIPVDTTKANSNGIANGNANGNSGSAPQRPSHQNQSLTLNSSHGRGLTSTGYKDPRFSFDGMRSLVPWSEGPVFSNGQHRPATTTSISSTASHNSTTAARNQNHHPLPHVMVCSMAVPVMYYLQAASLS